MKVTVGRGSCGIAAGATEVFTILQDECDSIVTDTGCVGMCYLEPIVNVMKDDILETFVKVDKKGALEISKYTKGKENNAKSYAMSDQDLQLLKEQPRIVLRNCGLINPEEIEEYKSLGGYEALQLCLHTLTPEQVIEEIKESGLGGRGGAGFPTWFKWDAARRSEGDVKYVICNADEGDPGAFMDRAILEGDPHSVIEGMAIAAYAIGAKEGIVYVRAEYPLAIQRLQIAIDQALEEGLLGENILGLGFTFVMRIKAGAGAFVCGEETALIASLEGERGMPRLKPPFPASKGFWKKPSNINNVETYANVPWIMTRGGTTFAKMGTESAKGTKVFALTGRIKNGGLVEVPMGKSIRDVVYGPGGGIKEDRILKAVQMGGPSGGCIPESLCDTSIDYKALQATGAIMGSGGMVVMDDSTCMVDMARFFLDFTCKESCGKCTHCRIGTRRMLEILERICAGDGEPGDIELLEDLATQIKAGSLCGLGQTAPNPVLTTIRYFRNEYEDHIQNHRCTAKSCKSLLHYTIIGDKCISCGLCKRKCPAKAISGEPKLIHCIDPSSCIKCGECVLVCPVDAILVD